MYAILATAWANYLNIFVIQNFDVLENEEWSKKSSLPQVYRYKKDNYIRKRLQVFAVFHAYMIYAITVLFYISYYCSNCIIAATG